MPNTIKNIAQTPKGITKQQQAANQAAVNVLFGPFASDKQKKLIARKLSEQQAGTTAVGLNRFTTAFIKQVKFIDKKTDEIVNGKPTDPNSKHINPLNYGLIPLVELIASIDLCNILNYLIDQIPGGKKFNPNETTQRSTALGRIKYDLQYAAYRVQGYIDGYYNSSDNVLNPKNPENVSKLQQLLINIVTDFKKLSDAADSAFNNPDLNNAFPQLANSTNYITIATQFFDKYTDVRNIPSTDYQKILRYIDRTKTVCILIQGLDKPRDLLNFADYFLGGKVAKEIQKLSKIIDPKKIESVIKDIQSGVDKANRVVKAILSFVNITRTIVSIANVLIKIFNIVVAFLEGLPIPSMFGNIGIHVKITNVSQKLKTIIKQFSDRLSEINRILGAIYYFCSKRSLQFGQLLNSLQIIIINLQNCNLPETQKDPENNIISNLNQAINQTEIIKANLDTYVSTYDNNSKKRKKRIGEYTIEILNEEITDEGISIRRRYGVALDTNKVVVAKSTPTFATNDAVIIEEVKLLLPKKVGSNVNMSNIVSLIPQEDLDILDEANNYLETDEPEDSSFDIEDQPDTEDTDSEDDDPPDGLGLQSFINKLKGGKRLRRRMRREMAKSKRKLADDMQRANPNAPKSKKAELNALKAELDVIIDNIKAKKNQLKASVIALAASFGTNAVLIAAIVLLKKKIKELEKERSDKITQIKKLDPTFTPPNSIEKPRPKTP
jgi:hypothetical protein